MWYLLQTRTLYKGGIMQRTYNYLNLFFDNLQSQGRYTFTLKELKNEFEVSDEALKKALNRVVKKGRAASIRKGFYVIVPPEYFERGVLPPYLFINELMGFLQKPYYVGLLSAAAFHGAGHQQPQEFYVITQKPAIRSIRSKGIKINFNVKSIMPKSGLEERKTDTGYIIISGPELTAIDLMQYENRIGGLSRVMTLLDELVENINVIKLKEILDQNIPTACLQRLGYVFEKKLGMDQLTEVIYKYLKGKRTFLVPLKAAVKKAGYPSNRKWKVIENTNLEGDL